MTLYEKLAEKFGRTDFGVLLTGERNRFYVTHFSSSALYVAITPERTVFYTDFRYTGAATAAKEKGIIPPDVDIVQTDKTLYVKLQKLFAGLTDIYIEEDTLSLHEYENLQEKLPKCRLTSGASSAFGALRAVKMPYEIDAIRDAQAITDGTFSHMLNYLSDNIGKGITERDAALEIDYTIRRLGGEKSAFDTIAVCAEKSAMPHGEPDDSPIRNGFLTMDFGAMKHGYCSDMTRTVCIGRPTDDMKAVYDTVLGAQMRALENIHAGITGKDADMLARSYIDESGYKGAFGHSLGHSLGLYIHESPGFSLSYSEPIPENAVLSVEPGIYLTGKFGVRIEDIVRITACSCENFTKSKKELIIL